MISTRQVDKLGEEKCIHHFVRKGEGKKQLGRLKSKWKDIRSLNKYSLKVWPGFISPTISNNEGKVLIQVAEMFVWLSDCQLLEKALIHSISYFKFLLTFLLVQPP